MAGRCCAQRMGGMTLLGWRAQSPTPYAHLLPPRSRTPRQQPLRPLQLPHEHRFRRTPRRSGVVRPATRPEVQPPCTSARSLCPSPQPPPISRPLREPSPPNLLPQPPPISSPVREPLPPKIDKTSSPSPSASHLALPRLPTSTIGNNAVELKGSSPKSPGRSILSRDGVLGSRPRSLHPIGRRVQLVEVPNVAPSKPAQITAPRSGCSTPPSVRVNSQWGPAKSVRVGVPPKRAPPANAKASAHAGAQKQSDWFNSFGNRARR